MPAICIPSLSDMPLLRPLRHCKESASPKLETSVLIQ